MAFGSLTGIHYDNVSNIGVSLFKTGSINSINSGDYTSNPLKFDTSAPQNQPRIISSRQSAIKCLTDNGLSPGEVPDNAAVIAQGKSPDGGEMTEYRCRNGNYMRVIEY